MSKPEAGTELEAKVEQESESAATGRKLVESFMRELERMSASPPPDAEDQRLDLRRQREARTRPAYLMGEMERARQTVVSPEDAERLAEYFGIFADATRLRILTALADSRLRVVDLALVLEMEHSATSHQLAVLRSARMVQRKRNRNAAWYSLANDGIGSLIQLARAAIVPETRPGTPGSDRAKYAFGDNRKTVEGERVDKIEGLEPAEQFLADGISGRDDPNRDGGQLGHRQLGAEEPDQAIHKTGVAMEQA